MANFRASFTSGVVLTAWTDPADADRPSRLNAKSTRPHQRQLGTVGTEVQITAVVDGAGAPLDAALGGDLFYTMWADYPTSAPLPAVSSPVGQSSVQRFTPAAAGHYCIVMRRANGGGIFMHVDVE
jgi:hypothetical protein